MRVFLTVLAIVLAYRKGYNRGVNDALEVITAPSFRDMLTCAAMHERSAELN